MRLSGLRSYLKEPKRAVFASLIITVVTVLLMVIFKPVFPEKTTVYRMLSPVGAVEIEPGKSIDVKFKSFTDFDSASVAIYPDSPSVDYKLDIRDIGNGEYILTITNPGDANLKVALSSSKVYGAIEPYNETGTVTFGLYKNGSPNSFVFTFVTFFTALFVFFVSFAFFTDNLTPSKFYLIAALTLGLGAYPILFPAWSAHDSDAHFQAAYRFSNILLGKGGGWTARECDVEFFRGSWKRFVFEGGYRPDPSGEMYLPQILNNQMFAPSDKTRMVVSDGGDYAYMLFYGPFNYLPLSIGFALGRLIRLSPMYMIHLGRYLQGIFFVLITWRAIGRIKSENVQYLLALVSLFPMSLAYLTSFSYDGAVLAYFICALASMFCLKEDSNWTRRNVGEALFWIFLVGNVKGGAYVILIPMAFMLLRKPVKDVKNLLPLGLTASAFLGMLFSNVLLKPKGEELFQLVGSEASYSTSFAYQHPLKYLVMCVKTLLAFAGDIITDSVGRSEGWNEAVIPGITCVIILAATIIVAVSASKKTRVTRAQAISFAVACLFLLLCAPAMLLRDTPIEYELIMGVQGRYFRPMAPLLIMLIVGITEFVASKLDKKSLEKLTGKAGAVKDLGLVLFAAGELASVISLISVYLAR